MTLRRVLLVAALVAGLGVVLPGSVSATSAACDNAPLPGAPTLKVLVMGDSLSQQFAGDFTWRDRFWWAERAKGVNIDFVGPYTGLMRTWDTPVDNNQDYADPCFDKTYQTAHFAVGSKDLAATLQTATWDSAGRSQVAWATAYYQPDVVVGFMGYNDLKAYNANPVNPADGHHGYTADQLLATAKSFVAQVQGARPGTPVAMATVLSTKAPDVPVDASSYNTKLKAAVADWSTAADPVGLIDVTTDWKAAPTDTWDGYHPNENGEMHLAWDVADGLHAMGLAAAALDRPIPVEIPGPPTPGTVSVTGGTSSSVDLTWTFPIGADRETLGERDLTAGTDWVVAHDVRYDKGYTVTGLAEHQYQFRVQAAKGTAVATGVYSPSVDVDLRPFPPIGVPQVAAERHAASVTWPAVDTADHYEVRWRRAHTSSWSLQTTTGTTSVVSGLIAGAHYVFTVTPVRDRIDGSTSATVPALVEGYVNAAGAAPHVVEVNGDRLRVTWSRASHATRYQVRIRGHGGSWHTLGWTTSTRMTSKRLVKGRTYAVDVIAFDSYVAGHASSTAVHKVS
ncbi:MAG: lipolytic protein family [Marmoricola sp.]|nr:lipolytic protein family [Marmoricola sp.]